jgi:thiopeptide-type bacteriocin biosynthesis protein
VSVAPSAALDATLARAAAGASVDELSRALVDDDTTLDEARAFVAQLVDGGLLLDDEPPQPATTPPRATIAEAALRDALAILHKLHRGVDPLGHFIAELAARFGDDEVPLLVALDPEAGVGPLATAHDNAFTARDALLVERLAAHPRELALTADDVAALPEPALPLAAAYTAHVEQSHSHALAELVACAAPAADPPLPLDDLTLALEFERLTLRSRSLNREVHPPIDERDRSPIARLLRALPHQGTIARLAFEWGPLAALPSLPIVRAGSLRVWPPPAGPLARATLGDPPRAPSSGRRPTFYGPRRFQPGSEWLGVQLFGAATACDAIACELAAPFAARVGADCWYFLRYPIPSPHVLLRVRVGPSRLVDALRALAALAAPLYADGRLVKWELASYAREIGRYGGGAGVIVAERIFHRDSEATVALLAVIDPADHDARFALALAGIEALLADLGVDPLATLRAMQREHFRIAPRDVPDFVARYDARRDDLRRVRARAVDELADGFDVLARRSAALAPLVAELRAHEATGRLSRTIAEQAPSYLHMFANRLLVGDGSLAQERELYDLLRRSLEDDA